MSALFVFLFLIISVAEKLGSGFVEDVNARPAEEECAPHLRQ